MNTEYGRVTTFSDANLLPNWHAPFRKEVPGEANTHSQETLFNMRSPYWGAMNLITRYYGSGTDVNEISPFTKVDGTEFTVTTEATVPASNVTSTAYPIESGGTRRTITYRDAAFVDNRIYSLDIAPSLLSSGHYNALYVRFQITRASVTSGATHSMRVILQEFVKNSNGVPTERVLEDSLTFGSNRIASFNQRIDDLDFKKIYRIVLEQTYTPSASESAPNITLNLPGLQVVVLRENDGTVQPATLGTNDVIGGLDNDTGTITQWLGSPWKSPSRVLARPDFVSRIQFTSITGNGTPGIAFDEHIYPNNSNVIPLPISANAPITVGGGDISVFRHTYVTLRNTHATPANSVTFSGVLVGLTKDG